MHITIRARLMCGSKNYRTSAVNKINGRDLKGKKKPHGKRLNKRHFDVVKEKGKTTSATVPILQKPRSIFSKMAKIAVYYTFFIFYFSY
jgi:hypothetical protein